MASPRAVLALAVASQASVSICSWGLGALVPELRAELALSAAQVGTVVAAGALGTALALVPAGALIDRVGPRRPTLAAAVGAAAFLVAAGRAGGAGPLSAAFFAFGLCQAVITLAGAVSILQTFPPQHRGTAMGLRQMAVSLGGLIAAGLLPGLAVLGGSRLALSVSAVLAGVAGLAFGMVSPDKPPPGTPRSLRIDALDLLRLPGMARLLAIAALYAVALSSVLNLAVDGLRAEGASIGQGSALFVVISLSAMTARVVWGRLADRGPQGAPRRWSALAAIFVVLVLGALGYWLVAPFGPSAQIPVMAVFAFGVLGANGVIYLIAGELAGVRRSGQAVALASVVLFGVGALALPALGWQADRLGYRSLWLDCAALGLVILAMAWTEHRRCAG